MVVFREVVVLGVVVVAVVVVVVVVGAALVLVLVLTSALRLIVSRSESRYVVEHSGSELRLLRFFGGILKGEWVGGRIEWEGRLEAVGV